MRREVQVVLVVASDAFHLGWMGATRRLFHIAEAFQKLGFSVVLLAGRMTNPSVQRDIDAEFPGVVLRTRHTGDYPRLFDTSRTLRRVWRAGWKTRGSEVYWSKLHWGWAERLNLDKLKDQLAREGIKPTLVWGISAGYLDGAVAAERIARAYGVPWVMELHDPPRRAGLGEDSEIIKQRFAELLTAAAKVVVTARTYGLELADRYSLPEEKWATVHLTYEGKTVVGELVRKNVFYVVYVGSLDGGRSLSALVEALQGALRFQPEMRSSFRFELAGAGPGFEEVARLSVKYGLEELIHIRGLIPRNEGDRLVAAAAVVVVQENTSPLQVPGKVFESIKAGKPVLGLMPENCEAAEILRQSGLGFIHHTRDVEGIRSMLIRLWQAWQRGEQIVSPNWAYIEQFSTERLPEKLANVLSGIVELPKLNTTR